MTIKDKHTQRTEKTRQMKKTKIAVGKGNKQKVKKTNRQ